MIKLQLICIFIIFDKRMLKRQEFDESTSVVSEVLQKTLWETPFQKPPEPIVLYLTNYLIIL